MPALRKSPKRRTSSKPPGRTAERRWSAEGLTVAGVDEVGRGAWAGPLVAAAVVLPEQWRLAGVRDSKLLAAAQRERLANGIRASARAVGVGVVAVEELNRHGFSWALRECGIRCVRELGIEPGRVLLDGRHDYFGGAVACETIIGGDGTERCIAAASIIAKVRRDALMREFDTVFPGYGFADHKGYGTPAHRRALAERGPTALHRVHWRPVAERLRYRVPA